MYQDILMKLSQQQHHSGAPRTPSNATANLLAAAATGNPNLLQNSPNLMHQVKTLLHNDLYYKF